MKSKIIAIVLACIGTSLARADFTPIPLDPTSFNQDPVIEKTAPPSINDYVTVSMDQGTNKNGNTLYELGYVTTNTTGVPVHGSLFVKTNTTTLNVYTFQMPPDYHTNNCLFVGHNNGGWTPISSPAAAGSAPATFTIKTPAPFNTISVLNSTGNGAAIIQYTVHFSNGTTETGTFSATDWFSGNGDGFGVTRQYVAHGTVGMNGGANNQNGANNGVLWANDIPLSDTTDNVTSIDFQWVSGSSNANSPWGNSRTAIWGLAGSTDSMNFTPITVSGYNQDAVIEADAPKTWQCGPESITGTLTNNNAYCSFTMDGGTNKYNYTWYEKGYYASYPNSGLPTAGSTFSSGTLPYIQYTMPSSYATNCAVCLSSNILRTQIKFATPTSASALSFLAGSGNGPLNNIRVEIGFQGGSSETNFISVPDWFNRGAPWAYFTFGQVRPGNRAFANTPDQYLNPLYVPPPAAWLGGMGPQPFYRDPRTGGQLGTDLPLVRLFDCVVPVSNSSATISTINLVVTNATLPNVNVTVAIFAISGSPGTPPIITTQPTGIVVDNTTGLPIVTNAAAVADNIRITKGYQGTNNILLVTSNLVSTGVSYQWKKAPRGGGLTDILQTFNMSTFVNVSAPNLGGATSPILTISNASLADSGDYLLIASNQFGSMTSYVATVMVLTTNYSLLVGSALGDTITKWSNDGTSTGAENYLSASDQVIQKWLSTGLGGGLGFNGVAIPSGSVPFVGPVGYIVTPAAGASFVNSIRWYCSNDTPGRDPRDYLLEGSNDGSTWTPITGGQLTGTLYLPVGRNSTGAVPLNPMTQSLLEVDFANSTSWKSYRLSITNVMDPTSTPLMQIAEIQLLGSFVPAPPTWVLQPVPTVTAFVGTSPTLTASATGQGALAPHYQWYQSPSTLIAGATGSSYTITNIQTTASGTSYYVVAQNSSGNISSSIALITVVAAPTQSYPSAVLADKPMAYWRLDESPDNGSGNNGVLTHDYAGGHNGNYTNTALVLPGYSAFDPDTAAGFGTVAAADSFVDNIAAVDFARASGNAAFSIEAWVFGATPTGTGAAANPAIIAKGNNGILAPGIGTGTEQYAIDLTTTGFRFLVRGPNGQGYQAQSSVKPSDVITGGAAWHHLVGVCDEANGNLFLYVDGLLAATGTIPANTGILTQPLPTTIGSRRNTQADDFNNQWIGTIDDVAVYPSVLTPNQALAHFLASQTPPVIQGPAYLILGTNWIAANNVPVTFPANAYGPGTLSYQWWQSDNLNPTTPISGATSSNYTFITAPAMDNTFFQLVVSNQYGAVTSAVVSLSLHIGAPDFIVDLPSQQNIFLGHIIQLSVNPGGTGPFTYQWQKNGANILNDYRTSGVQSNTLTIGYANTNDAGGYQVIVTGSAGSAPSTMDAITVSTNRIGFFGASSAPSAWALNGTPSPTVLYPTNALQMTAGLGGTARSAWLTTKQNITSFGAFFTYQTVGGTGGQADGVSFCIQNDTRGTTALGAGGGGLALDGITPSVALALNIYDPNTRGIAFNLNGAGGRTYYSLLPNVSIGGNANPVQVNMSYDGVVLAFKFTDTVTGLSVSTNWTVNIPSVVGGDTAYVGFTGGDGGVTSTQLVWWPANTVVLQPTPLRMTTQKVGNTIVLSWPAANGGYLQTSPTVGPTAAWTYSTAPWQLIGTPQTGIQQATVPIGAGAAYLRLQQLAP